MDILRRGQPLHLELQQQEKFLHLLVKHSLFSQLANMT